VPAAPDVVGQPAKADQIAGFEKPNALVKTQPLPCVDLAGDICEKRITERVQWLVSFVAPAAAPALPAKSV